MSMLPGLGSADSFKASSRTRNSATTQKGAAPPASSDWSALIADLQERLPALLAQAPTVPAVSMSLVAGAKIVWQGAFGVKDFNSKTTVDRETIFEAGSVSKTAFAYRVMKLCERGGFDLDRPLTKYTPDQILKEDPRLDLITTRNVLRNCGRSPPGRCTNAVRTGSFSQDSGDVENRETSKLLICGGLVSSWFESMPGSHAQLAAFSNWRAASPPSSNQRVAPAEAAKPPKIVVG